MTSPINPSNGSMPDNIMQTAAHAVDHARTDLLLAKASSNEWTFRKVVIGVVSEALLGERQRNAEIMEEVRKVLGYFAEAAASYDPDEGDGDQVAWSHDFKIGSLRAARALLSKLGEL